METTITPIHFCQSSSGKLSHIVESTPLTLSTNVFTVSHRFCMSNSMSALESPKPAVKFWSAAFMESNEPLTVSLASLAVVPVMPISVCVTWIASINWSNGISFTFSAVASNESPMTPDSFTSLAISLAVPPYIYIHHRSLIYDRSLMNCCMFPCRLDYILCVTHPPTSTHLCVLYSIKKTLLRMLFLFR